MGKLIGSTSEITSDKEEKNERIELAEEQQKSSFLPQRVESEEKIQSRPDRLSELKKTLEKDVSDPDIKNRIMKTIAKGGGIALDSLALIDERIQGAVAGPLYEMQDLSQEDVIRKSILSALDGATGKRKVRFEDVMRSAMPEMKIGEVDVSEPIAVIGGLGVELGVGTKVIKAAQNALKGGPQTLKSIEKTYELAKEVKKASGRKISQLFGGKVGDKTINPLLEIPEIANPENTKKLIDIVNGLPKGVMKKILSDNKTYEVAGEIEKSGKVALDYSSRNIWNLRKALDDLITEGEFAKGVTKIAKGKILDTSNMLRRALTTVDKKVAPLMDQYSEYSRVFGRASEILTSKGRVVVNKAGEILKRQGEPEAQRALQEFASLFPRGAKMLKDIRVLNRNRAATNLADLALKATVGGAIFSRFIRKPTYEAIGADTRELSEVSG